MARIPSTGCHGRCRWLPWRRLSNRLYCSHWRLSRGIIPGESHFVTMPRDSAAAGLFTDINRRSFCFEALFRNPEETLAGAGARLRLQNDRAAEHVVTLALGTSLAAIVFSAAQSAYGHYRRGSASIEIIAASLPGSSLAF
jgi:hypothetical protein